jgi:hypothetical protein
VAAKHKKELAQGWVCAQNYRDQKKAKRSWRGGDGEDETEDDQGGEGVEEMDVAEKNQEPIAGINGHNVANVLWPDTQKWRVSRNGTRGATVKNRNAKQTNYFHPFLFMWIEDVVRRNDFKATASANAILRDPSLHCLFPQLKGTIQKCIDPAGKCFRPNFLEKVARGKGQSGNS